MDCEQMGQLGVRKGAWTDEEDFLLRKYVAKYGEGNWHKVPQRAGLNRCRKSCRLRWINYLSPTIKRGPFTEDEIDLIIRLHKLLGNRWSLIAGRLPGRTANDVKNYWNTHLRKTLAALIDKKEKPKPQMVQVKRPKPLHFIKRSIQTTSDVQALGNPQQQQQQQHQEQSGMPDCTVEDSMWWNNLLIIGKDISQTSSSVNADVEGLYSNSVTTDIEAMGDEILLLANRGDQWDDPMDMNFWC